MLIRLSLPTNIVKSICIDKIKVNKIYIYTYTKRESWDFDEIDNHLLIPFKIDEFAIFPLQKLLSSILNVIILYYKKY